MGLAFGFAGAVLLFILMGLLFFLVRPWVRIKFKGGSVGLMAIVGMRLRGTPIQLLEDAYISLIHSGARVNWREIESQFLANQKEIRTAQDLEQVVLEHKKRSREHGKNKS